MSDRPISRTCVVSSLQFCVRHGSLPPHRFRTDYVPTDSLVAWYPFSGNFQDESGNEQHATPVAVVVLTDDRFGQPNAAFYVDGDNDHVQTPLIFNSSLDRTISVWFKLDDPSRSIQTIVNTNPHEIESHGWNVYFLPDSLDAFAYCFGTGGWDIVCGDPTEYYLGEANCQSRAQA